MERNAMSPSRKSMGVRQCFFGAIGVVSCVSYVVHGEGNATLAVSAPGDEGNEDGSSDLQSEMVVVGGRNERVNELACGNRVRKCRAKVVLRDSEYACRHALASIDLRIYKHGLPSHEESASTWEDERNGVDVAIVMMAVPERAVGRYQCLLAGKH